MKETDNISTKGMSRKKSTVTDFERAKVIPAKCVRKGGKNNSSVENWATD